MIRADCKSKLIFLWSARGHSC